MKKFLIFSAIILSLSFLTPLSLSFSNEQIGLSIMKAEAKLKSKKKKNKKQSEKGNNTAERIKKLDSMGVPKNFYKGSYGKDLSLDELGKIIGNWILSVYKETGQLPGFKSSDLSNWLVLNINGKCVSSSEVCNRWTE